MATLLRKAVKRQLVAPNRRGATMLATMEPGDLLSFREKGKRTEYTISLHSCYVLAAAQFLNDQYHAKLKQWESRGKRGRKPKAPNFGVFSRSIRVSLQSRA